MYEQWIEKAGNEILSRAQSLGGRPRDNFGDTIKEIIAKHFTKAKDGGYGDEEDETAS